MGKNQPYENGEMNSACLESKKQGKDRKRREFEKGQRGKRRVKEGKYVKKGEN